jgi:hypothetical protein
LDLPIWTESEELRPFVAGHLAMPPIRKTPVAIDRHFIEYLLELTDGDWCLPAPEAAHAIPADHGNAIALSDPDDLAGRLQPLNLSVQSVSPT